MAQQSGRKKDLFSVSLGPILLRLRHCPSQNKRPAAAVCCDSSSPFLSGRFARSLTLSLSPAARSLADPIFLAGRSARPCFCHRSLTGPFSPPSHAKKGFEQQQPGAPIRRPNLPLISPPIPCKNRISRRSNTRDFELNQTTLRKTAIEKGQRATAEKKGQRATGDRNRDERSGRRAR
ncbi:Uncharacterized protein Fot_07519 [Forsythia ovata]|uniref:Uncharacterized protein n=1 Tax=Forsythia ovata TaxID=205694 RepID=A0ABD1WWR7_9LAMI